MNLLAYWDVNDNPGNDEPYAVYFEDGTDDRYVATDRATALLRGGLPVLFQHSYRHETVARVSSQREFQQSQHQESKPLSLVAYTLTQLAEPDPAVCM
jgi:hypothetical protein